MFTLDRQEQIRQRYKAMKPGYRPALEIYKELMNGCIHDEMRLLDAGCGPGGLVKEYAGMVKLVVGTDRYATTFTHLAEIPTLVEAALERLPYADNSFDLVTSSWVFEHLREPEITFAEIVRVLKPGGQFLFITPNKNNYVVWLRRIIPNRPAQKIVYRLYGRDEEFINPTYYRANSYRDIHRLLTKSGLQSERFEHVSDPSYLAMNEILFRLSILAERVLDAIWPRGRVHLVGLYRKEKA
ncbi:MAG TPA: methyltransferase domain-containing protein [Phototrophicaceae bacterium]|nr:methyltransferase domain-containing protein [Phototrophicaceae bacterium]